MTNITINGKDYPVDFGVAATAEVYTAIGLKFTADGFGQSIELNYETMLKMAHIGLKHGARKSRQAFDLDYYDVCDLLEEDPDKLASIVEMFNDSQSDSAGNAKGRQKKAASK